MEATENLYRVLGVAESATEEELKNAYRRLAKKYHPDAHPSDAACEKKFQAVNEAYSILGDPQKRKKYDAARSRGGEKKQKLNPKTGNPLDTTDLFERFMGIKR